MAITKLPHPEDVAVAPGSLVSRSVSATPSTGTPFVGGFVTLEDDFAGGAMSAEEQADYEAFMRAAHFAGEDLTRRRGK